MTRRKRQSYKRAQNDGMREVSEARDRLRVLYDVGRELATFRRLDDLLRFATRRARELFRAEGCALLLLDEAKEELYFPIASQTEAARGVETRLSQVRFPAGRGIAGWVLREGESAVVPDVGTDERFFAGVDRHTEMKTRSLLCAPLRSHSGNIGVIEVVNPAPDSFTADDVEFLEALAADIALAYENAALYEQLRGEVIGLRGACTAAGLLLLAFAAVAAAGAVMSTLAHALPWGELVKRSGFWAAVVAAPCGALLLAFARGWLGTRTRLA